MSEPFSSSPEGYEIRREIGRGATAIVYLAYDEKHDRLVALKHLQSDLLLTPMRFVAEIHTIAGMQHPHILPLHDSGVWDGAPFFVMPYVNGETLEQRIRREGALPISDAVRIAEEVGDALEYAHRNGVIHRDVKPANILLADDHAYVADFGIAHVISLASEMRVTGSGFAVGTPAYMSPEQAAGRQEVDGRSDIYSLGCVLFEMLTGQPPFPGATPRAVIARRASGPPDAVRALRPKVPEALEQVVVHALAQDPDGRYATAGEFVRELTDAETEVEKREARGSRQRVAIVAGAVIALGAAGVLYARGASDDPNAVDQYTYAVFPFRHAGSAQNTWLDGDGCARLLHDAMARWQGVRLVDDMRVSDVWNRQQPRTVADAFSAAKTLRAGQLAWGEVVGIGDSLEIRVVAYDIQRGSQPTRQFVVRLPRDAPQLDSVFSALADSVIIGGRRIREGAATGTKNIVALEKFLDGRAAVDHFNLRLAEQDFRDALAVDESYAHAHFWLARTMAWEGDAEPSAWTGNAARAVALSPALAPRDRSHASALLDLAEGRMAEACQRYRALIASDSLDFAAWYGLGDCNARDPVVVRDAKSPHGYSFRGSMYTAINSYQRALTLVPSYHVAERGLAFGRLSHRVLYTEEARPRRGVAILPDTQRFAAFPSFAANTLAFVPQPYSVAISPSRPATERKAVMWGAETYRQLMVDRVRAFPASADAQESYALALESVNGIGGSGAEMPTALAAARNSLKGAIAPPDRTRREVMVVRLLLKMDSMAPARALADSALREWRSPTPDQAGYLAGLAALTGRAARAAALSARAASDSDHVPFVARDGRRASLPTDLTAGALELQTYAAIGGPRDSLRATLARTSRLINTWVPAAEQADVRQMIFRNTFGLAYDQLAPVAQFTVAPDRDQRLAMRMALSRRDTAEARRASRTMIARASQFTPGTMGIDQYYHHAVMLLALGDTAGATTQLNAALTGLPRSRNILLRNMPEAGAVVPTMALRADLAWQARDYPTFDRWARPAALLWSDADPELHRRVDLLRNRLRSRQP